MSGLDIDHEISVLVEGIKRLGKPNDEGKIQVIFKELFDDDKLANTLEALVGTMKAAKRKGIITFKGQILLQGAHDNEPVILLQE